MKSRSWFTMINGVLVCSIAVLLAAALVQAEELPLVVKEDFDGSGGQLPESWVVLPRGGSSDTPDISKEQALSGEYSLRIWRTRNAVNMTNWVAIQFTPLKERAVISFSFWASDVQRSLVMSLIGSDQPMNSLMGGEAGPFLVLRNGALQNYDTAFWDIAPYVPEKWYRVSIDIDVTAAVFDVYVDGEKANFVPLKYRNNKVSDIAAFGIGFHAASNTAGYLPVYIDDFEVRGK
ncbi:MAG TPA: hypothetical protein GXX29_06070 [Firmicutes bacterium]|nr:hypothetical protein [Bacillota bacterium]